MSFDEMYKYMLDNSIVSEETLDIVTRINGEKTEILELVLYIKTGFQNLKQYAENN